MFSSMLSLLGSLRRGNFVTNSLRFRSSASANLSRTPSVAGNRQVWTWSAWVKRGTLGEYALFGATLDASNRTFIRFNSSDQLDIRRVDAGTSTGNVTTAVFRDCSAWYHVVISVDFSQASATSRAIIYVNGVQQTLGTSSVASGSAIVNLNTAHRVGYNESSFYFDGYLTEINFIDGQALTPSSFGQIESTTGVWSPKQYVGSYGTNGFYLKFADASAATAAAIGKDSSGNGNNWTPSGISVTAGATYDSMIDVPVSYADGGNGRGNYCTLNLLRNVIGTISDAGLNYIVGTTANKVFGTIGISSGKWYWECSYTSFAGGGSLGIATNNSPSTSHVGVDAFSWSYLDTAQKANNNVIVSYGATYTTGDIIGVAFDADLGSVTFYKNNISQGVAYSGLASDIYFPVFGDQNSVASSTLWVNFGQRPFAYTPPAGFRALNTNNLPTPSIVNGANFMAATTYTGNAAARSLSNAVNSVSFQPDLVWIKSRTPGATNHALFDSVRGATKYLSSNTTIGETTLAQGLTAFNADGFSLGTDTTLVNANANSYIAWQWKESITAGLDIVSYTGTGVARTVAHNLGVTPAMIIVKDINTAVNWVVYQSSQGANKFLRLNTTDAVTTDATIWNNTAPTSSVFSVGGVAGVNTNSNNYVAYCFAEVAGFSRFGSYTGNGSADGPFVFCGFRPRFVMIKQTNTTNDWVMFDTARNSFNENNIWLRANDNGVEIADTILPNDTIDHLSNGFKVRGADTRCNANGGTYIFAAFAEVPSKYALAR